MTQETVKHIYRKTAYAYFANNRSKLYSFIDTFISLMMHCIKIFARALVITKRIKYDQTIISNIFMIHIFVAMAP